MNQLQAAIILKQAERTVASGLMGYTMEQVLKNSQAGTDVMDLESRFDRSKLPRVWKRLNER